MHERFKKSKRGLRGGAALCLSLLCMFPVCTGNVKAAAAGTTLSSVQELIPVGHTIGIKLFSRGILVVNLSDGDTPAKSCGLAKGDVILKCDGNTVTSTEQFQKLLQDSGGKAVTLQVRRGGSVRTLTATPDQNEAGKYAIGAWIRDSMAGIGTMTFYDPQSGVFGALGHGITDTDTALLMPFSAGSILPSAVKAVKKGEIGVPGELRGDFDLAMDTGRLYANTEGGIFGTLEDLGFREHLGNAVPVAENSEVKPGKATILANVEGNEVKEYEVEITRLFENSPDSRDLLLTVTDPQLLKITGGIVQGMSGSPILQNGKLVGAVTHVLLNDPTRGYGILIRNMLECADPQTVENVS
jgi:stage IV sporulation protein B